MPANLSPPLDHAIDLILIMIDHTGLFVNMLFDFYARCYNGTDLLVDGLCSSEVQEL
jgi:hypothetical protein